MSSPLHYRNGQKFGLVFSVRHAGEPEHRNLDVGFEKIILDWHAVGVRTILKDHWQDGAGQWRDSIYFYELEPGPEENRIEQDEFYIAGRFTIARQEKVAARALQAWKAFTPS